MEDDTFDLRRQLRVSDNIKEKIKYIPQSCQNQDEEEDYDANYDENSNIRFYEHLSKLLDKNEEEIAYFMRYFKLNDVNLLLKAIQSKENFYQFLMAAILSNSSTTQYNALQVILIISFNEEENNFFVNPQFLTFLLQKINDDSFDYRITALDIITNLIIQFKQSYEFFSQNNFVSQLIPIIHFRDEENNANYKEAYNRESRIVEEVTYTIYVITKDFLFKPNEAPILWNTLLFLFTKECNTNALKRIFGNMGNLIKSGYCGQFSEEIIRYISEDIVFDSDYILNGFRYFMNCIPNPTEFFAELIKRGFMNNAIECIIEDRNHNPEEIYTLLGDLKFNTDNPQFLALTLQKLKGPAKYYTRVSIIYYLSEIIFPTSTDLIKLLINQNILILIDEFLTGEKSIIHTCLDFIEKLLNCYEVAFKSKASTFPNVTNLSEILNEMITTVDDDADAQIERILEKLN